MEKELRIEKTLRIKFEEEHKFLKAKVDTDIKNMR